MEPIANFTEQDLMKDLLTTEKQIISAYNTGVTESSCENLRQHLQSALTDSQNIQYQIFQAMNKKGWYNVKDADAQEVEIVKQQFNNIKNQLQ